MNAALSFIYKHTNPIHMCWNLYTLYISPYIYGRLSALTVEDQSQNSGTATFTNLENSPVVCVQRTPSRKINSKSYIPNNGYGMSRSIVRILRRSRPK